MVLNKSSNTYKHLFEGIIGLYLSHILKKFPNYCLENRHVPYDIEKKYNEYRNNADRCMKSKKLDRHKLASCVCGAIIEVQPIRYLSSQAVVKGANEIFALYVGLCIIKRFMIFDILNQVSVFEERQRIKSYLMNHFDILLPALSDNICDTQEYEQNLVNALLWTHRECDISQKECFKRYDIWAYAKIFYHLELYNKPRLDNVYKEYLKNKEFYEQMG